MTIRSLHTYFIECATSTCVLLDQRTYKGIALEAAIDEFQRAGWRREGPLWWCPECGRARAGIERAEKAGVNVTARGGTS